MVILFFVFETEKMKIDDVLGVWPLHGVAGTWGGFACGIFGLKSLGGLGGVNFFAQAIGSLAAVGFALASSIIVYSILKSIFGIRLSEHQEIIGPDLSIHNIEAYPEEAL